MESDDVPATKPDAQVGSRESSLSPPTDQLRKKRVRETSSVPTNPSESSRPPSAATTKRGVAAISDAAREQEDQDLVMVLSEERSPMNKSSYSSSTIDSKFEVAMKNQVSLSRATTVELDTLRDMMPKLRKEINTYGVNECQLIKELEKKLPSCFEHKDVRLDLVIDEIQRLRLNKRRTLAKLKETEIKIIELQSKMEVMSYEAGEVFWDSKIERLIGDADKYHQKLDHFTEPIEEKDSRENFRTGPGARQFITDNRTNMTTLSSVAVDLMTESQIESEQGYHPKLERSSVTDDDVSAEAIREAIKKNQNSLESHDLPSTGLTQGAIDARANSKSAVIVENEQAEIPPRFAEFSNNNISLPDPSSQYSEQAESLEQQKGDLQQSNNSADLPDFDGAVARAQKQSKRTRMGRIKDIIVGVLPAVACGLLIYEWYTGTIPRVLRQMFGG